MSVLVKSAFFLLMLKSVITDHSSNFSSEVCTSPNEEFQSCGTACPLTCSNIKNPPELCTLQCVIGCGCRTGFVKDSQSGNCVSPENCSEAICGENEKYNLCGTACAITCANYKKPLLKCTLQCVPGCECQDGFIRDTQTGKCVLAENCTEQCFENEIFMPGDGVTRRCEYKCNGAKKCRFYRDYYNNCLCKPNFYRDLKTLQCITKEECTKRE